MLMMGGLPSDVEREVLVRARDVTSPDYGCKPEDRDISEHMRLGSINLDKPSGPTSHEVVSWVKRILEIPKAGHGGTLDPIVTGVLPVFLQSVTKVSQTMLPSGKEYVCLMHIHRDVPDHLLKSVLAEFEGEIWQRPPVRAAVKRDLRTRTIYYLDLLERDNREVLMRVGCQSGTYMRKLCDDIGKALGCGAHMAELRRTQAGAFRDDDTLVTLHDLKDAYMFWKEDGDETQLRKVIQPVENAVGHLAKIVVRDGAVDALCHGASLAAPGVISIETGISKGDLVAIMTQKGELIALAKSEMTSKETHEAEHGIVAKPDRVVMNPGTYPRHWR